MPYARIARRAGLSSTGLISNHFADKSDLMAQAVSQTYEAIGKHMAARMGNVTTNAQALEAYIVDFVAGHRHQMKALLEIFLNGGLNYTRVMAAVIQRAVDGVPFLLETHPDIDLGSYADRRLLRRPGARRVGLGGADRGLGPACGRPAVAALGPPAAGVVGRDLG
jgi:AcrR family transcriptional regulator